MNKNKGARQTQLKITIQMAQGNKSQSKSSLGAAAQIAHGKSTTQPTTTKLLKTTSQKTLIRQKSVVAQGGSRQGKKTPLRQRDPEQNQQLHATQGSIQALSTTQNMVNASRRKFLQTPRVNPSNVLQKMQLSKASGGIQPQQSRQMIQKNLLSPVSTSSRQTIGKLASPKMLSSETQKTGSQKETSDGGTSSRLKTHVKNLSMNNQPIQYLDQMGRHSRIESTPQMPFSHAVENWAKSTSKHQYVSKQSNYLTTGHMHTPSLQSHTSVVTATLIKAPSSLAINHHKPSQSDKIPKMHLAERPKTTMLVQLQQNQSQKQFHHRQQTATGILSNRVLSPRHRLLQTQITEPGVKDRQGLLKQQRSSGDFTLQTFRHTSQSSMGLLSCKSSAPGHNQADAMARACRTSDTKKGAGSLTQPRFSTTTKTGKTVKKQGGKTGSITDSVSAFGHRKDSRRQLNKDAAISDDAMSNRSGRTQIIDEVLHQQKFDAYRDLQRPPANTMLNQYGIQETSSMGQIIEQEEDLQDISVDKGEIANELETEPKETSGPSYFFNKQKTSYSHAKLPAESLVKKYALSTIAQPSMAKTNNYIGGVGQSRVLSQNRAKTAINLQDLRGVSSGETAFHKRKNSNDTVIQTKEMHPKKNSLASLLKPVPSHKISLQKRDVSQDHLRERKISNEFMAYSQHDSQPRGLISESLVNSYLTGNGSGVTQSQKWMCSSKSAKNVLTSCSLGPKSELRQTEQAIAENVITILPTSSAVKIAAKKKELQPRVKVLDDSEKTSGEQPDDQQGLNTPSPHQEKIQNDATAPRVFGPKNHDICATNAIIRPGQTVTDNSLKHIQESFKSTLVDYTESMNENKITKLTHEQSCEMLKQACMSGDLRSVKRLSLVKGVATGAAVTSSLVIAQTSSDTHGNTPLHFACSGGHVDIVEVLIRKMGANVNQKNNRGETPLHQACASGHKGVIERLLLARADTNIADVTSGNTPLHVLALANHQKTQLTTVVSDTVRQTMGSSVPAQTTTQNYKGDDSGECLVTEDFVMDRTNSMTRLSLIELILPFSAESKSTQNVDGFMPYQLAQSETVVQLLQPPLHYSRSTGEQASSSPPITASQIQGQSNSNCDGGRNSVMTRNHSQTHFDQVIEVKPVSEAEMANVFTFFNQSSNRETLDAIKQIGTGIHEEQFTFQANLSIKSAEKSHSDVYQTQSSRDSKPAGKSHLSTQQRALIEEEKNNCRAFLDEDILQIDNMLSDACEDGNEYSATNNTVYQHAASHQSQQQLLHKPRKSTAQDQHHKNGPPNDFSRDSHREVTGEQALSASQKPQLQDSDTPAFRDSVPASSSKGKQLESGGNNRTGKTFSRTSQQRHPFSAIPRTTTTTGYEQTPSRKPKTKLSSQAKTNKSGQSPLKTASSQNPANRTVSNQTMDSEKSKKQLQTNTNPKLSKAKTLTHLRPLTATQQLTQNVSQSRIKLAEIVQHQQPQSDTKSRGSQSSRLKAPQKAATIPGRATTLAQNQAATYALRATQSAYDLKQKVDKQASQLVDAMQRSQSKTKLRKQVEIKPRIGPDQFVAHQLLGTGSFGEVFLIERKQDKKLLAMKVLCKKKIKQQNLKKYAITERNVMCSMGAHPFIVQLRYAFQTREHLFLISDYCPGGDLSQYLEIEGSFTEEKARLYVQEILLGIAALHKQNIIFRDLKPDNVIIDKKGHAMLTDFGLSRENVRRSEVGARSFCGSYAYLAPEMLKKNGHGKAVDWYLLGVILFEMVTGLPPYYADDKDQLFKNIIKDTIDMTQVKKEQKLSSECIDLMKGLLQKDPVSRIGTKRGAIEIIEHPFFRSTDWDAVYRKEIVMPEPYLASMAMDIIKQQPYLVAGHPHTVGEVCPREHRSYLPGWSFMQPDPVGTASMLSSSEKLMLDSDVKPQPKDEEEQKREDFDMSGANHADQNQLQY